jgi:hypothetical protein
MDSELRDLAAFKDPLTWRNAIAAAGDLGSRRYTAKSM